MVVRGRGGGSRLRYYLVRAGSNSQEQQFSDDPEPWRKWCETIYYAKRRHLKKLFDSQTSKEVEVDCQFIDKNQYVNFKKN